ncbi:MAG: hypothetical protein H7141_07670 [Burkholderiales bacterium]|nr:hypothetical protein [Bacteroidia bacterium]
MKHLLRLNIVLFFTLLSSGFYAQAFDKASLAKETEKIYYYSFSGILNPSSIDMIKDEILRMQFVTEVKIEYKAEKALGQVKLIAKEKYTNNDTDFEFSIYNLKMLLIRNNLMPSEYKSEVVSK